VGFEGVDKRIDVLATAIRAGLTVFDLEHLELAYAPPYGAAKDPVNMAGFIAANLLRGDLELWYAEDFPERTKAGVVVDVRDEDEYEVWHIPGAINIPLGRLRGSLDRFPQDKPVFLYCKVGFRSYLAYRILKQNGFKTATLAGGTLTFRACHSTGTCPDLPEPARIGAGEQTARQTTNSGQILKLDCCGLQCPGPIKKLAETIERLAPGEELAVCATDPGFATDVAAWCRSQGHSLLGINSAQGRVEARVRKGKTEQTVSGSVDTGKRTGANQKALVVFSGDLDKVLAAFVIANGAVSMGSQVTMFFTFWGLNALRRREPPRISKPLLDRMFGWMMPRGVAALKLSKLNMSGMGTALMKRVMSQKGVADLSALMAAAQQAGVKLVACSMSMEVMGIKREELIDGVEIGGVATFLAEADRSGMTLFI